MTLEDIQREIAALPTALPNSGDVAAEEPGAGPLQIVSKQGRLILRLSAAMEGLDSRIKQLAEESKTADARAEATADSLRNCERRARQMALECVHLMDALDWVHEATVVRGDGAMAAQIRSAQRDCLRRLAAVGITEIPAVRGGVMDGRLHEGLEAVPASAENADVPQYHILELVRRGYQSGTDVLRRADVKTVA